MTRSVSTKAARRILLGLVPGLFLLVASPAAAGPEREAAAVVALLASGRGGERVLPSDTELDALLRDPRHDPWLLAEHLLAHRRQDVAVQLAALTDEDDVGPLSSYVKAPGASQGGAERAEALAAARSARDAGEVEVALRHVERARAVEGRVSVFGVRAASLQGGLLLAADRRGEGIEAWLTAAEDALRIGWWRAADSLFSRVVDAAMRSQSLDLLARGTEGMRALREVHGDSQLLAWAVQDLGSIAHWRGDLPGALRHLNEALGLYESLRLLADVADVRSLRSWILALTGDFRAALDEQRVLAKYFEDRPRDDAWASNQVHLGLIRYGLGDEAGAVSALTQALEAYRTLRDAEGEVHAHSNLALTYLRGGRRDEAVEAWTSARVVAKASGDQVSAATANHDIGVALMRGAEVDLTAAALTDDPKERETLRAKAKAALAEGRALMEESLAVAKDVGVASLVYEAQHSLGEILVIEGRPDEALRLLEPIRAEARRQRAWSQHVSMTVTLAHAHLHAGDFDAALREVRTASDELASALGRLADADMARARSFASDVYDIGVSAAVQAKQEGDLIHFLEAGRAAALLRGLGGRAAALRATVPKALVDHLSETTRAKLAAFAKWHDDKKAGLRRARVHRKTYEGLRIEEERVLAEMGQAQAEAAARLAPSRLVSVRDVRRRLRATQRPGLNQVFALFNFQGEEATALLIESKGARVVSYPRGDLGALREAFGTLSAARKGDLDASALAVVKQLLVDPLGIPPGPTRLFVSPDRDLAYIPLSVVLPDDWELVWEPSATVYDLLAERRLRKGQGILGLGDPDYRTAPDPDALATRGGPRLVPLPGTRLEVEAITGTPEDRRLLSEQATERGLREALVAGRQDRSWKSVHLACHGLVDVELPALSCLAITPGDGEDGFLSSGEVLRLPLRTDLAVLSACQTGRGKFVRGEGVMSLTRAFMYAGASRVIVSLWDVDDKATAFLMQTFYRHWKAGRGTAEALRLAQLAVRDHEVEETVREPGSPPVKRMRRPWSDPKYWAAWVLWGLPD